MKGTTRFTRAQAVLIAGAAAVVFTRVFAFSLVLPGFREHGLSLAGQTDLLIGAALGAYGLTMAVAQLGLGTLSDRWGRKPVLLLGTALFVAGSVWSALAGSIWTLLAARLLQGLGGVASVALAAVGESVPAERRTTAMALVGIPAGLAFFLGFALGPFAQSLVTFRGLFWASAALGVLAIVPLVVRPLPTPLPVPAGGLARAVSAPVLALGAAGFATNFGMSEVAFFLSQRPLGRGDLALVLLGAFVAMAVVSKLVDRRPTAWPAIVLALGALATGGMAFLLAKERPGVWLGALAFFAGHAVLSAILPSQVSRIAGRSGGRGHGIQLVVAYLGSAAGGVAAGAAASRPVVATLFLGVAVGFAATAVALLLRGAGGAAPPQPSSEAPGGTPP